LRCFVAVDVDEHVRGQIAELSGKLRTPGIKASWVRPENLHLTLRFLGDITDEQRVAFAARLRSGLQHAEALTLQVSGVGAFPNVRRPSVVWAGLREAAGSLEPIVNAAEDAAQAIGLKKETRPFKAHITLARVRQTKDLQPLSGKLMHHAEFRGDEFAVPHVSLLMSELTPQGAVYTTLEEYPLCPRSSLPE